MLTIPNLGNAIAHDVNIVETLPPELTYFAGYTPTAQINGVDVAGFVGVPLGAPGGPLVWGAGNNDISLDVPPGETLELTYQVAADLRADPSVALTSTAGSTGPRSTTPALTSATGAGCPTITAPNDYCFGPVAADGAPCRSARRTL